MPPDGYYQRIRDLCDHYGILLIMDEVICGFGRTGAMFGTELFNIQPDIITVAKGLTSGVCAARRGDCPQRGGGRLRR